MKKVKNFFKKIWQFICDLYRPSEWMVHGWIWRGAVIVGSIVCFSLLWMFYCSKEPAQIDVKQAQERFLTQGQKPVVGSAMVGTTIEMIDTLLDKRGGFLDNDKLSPALFMDNIPNWERGVVTLLRETTQSLRNDFSRSQSQSAQLAFLERADNDMRISTTAWLLPSAESRYKDARKALHSYIKELNDDDPNNAQFYARADNLTAYLELISKSLGDIGQRLSASVGDMLIISKEGTTYEGEGEGALVRNAKTSWWKIDNEFYYARGYCWGLLAELRAIRIDFASTLQKKGALASLDQIITELEKTQHTIWSPMILNGDGFGFVANHSLVMGSYISRANAAIIDLQQLLRNG